MEGPSIYILATLLQPFVGAHTRRVGGNAHFEKKALIGQKIKSIYGHGKHLIIQLDTFAVVTHFLMYGSYRIDEEREEKVPRFAIDTGLHQFYFYNCSTKCYKRKDLKRSLDFGIDIMSDQWDAARAFHALRRHSHARIDDLLLDQSIFDGVGNIIKNEVLFRTRVAPGSISKNIPAKKLKEIIAEAQSYSKVFFEARKIFALRQTFQVYGKKECGCCHTPLIRGKTGTRNRKTFYCPHCQREY